MVSAYQNLKVWQKSIELVKDIYRLSSSFPKTETYSLVDQMKRAAVSIPSNIAEGDQRNTSKENINFLYIARGSAAELETQLIVSFELGFITKENLEKIQFQIVEVLKMLNALISYKKQ